MKKTILTALAAVSALAMNAEIVNATLDLGDFEGSQQQISGQNLEQAPFNFYYAGSGSQLIYSATEIAPLFEHGATINSISFRYGDPTFSHYTEFTADLQVYLQLLDADEFNYVDNKSAWFIPSNPSGIATLEYNWTMDNMGGEEVITLNFTEPLVITPGDAGKNLLVTSCADMRDGEEAQYWLPYVYNNSVRNYRMATFGYDGINDFMDRVADGGEISAQAQHSECFKYDLPVARIAYSYDDNADGVHNAVCDMEGAEIYDLQGRRVMSETPAAGIYVVRENGSAHKVVIK